MTVESVVHLLIWLIVLGVIFSVLYWLIYNVPLFEPFRKVAVSILMIAAAVVAILLLLSLLPGRPVL